MIDMEPHRKAIVTMDSLLDAWIESADQDAGAKSAVVEFMETDEYIAIPYQHRNLYFVTASKLRTYETLPEQAYKQYIQCLELPWGDDKDYFRTGRAFDYRITNGDEKYFSRYVEVDERVDVEQEIADTLKRIDEAKGNLKQNGDRSAVGVKAEQKYMMKLAALQEMKGKSQLTKRQWKDVEIMTQEYRKQPCFPQQPQKLNLLWLAFGKIPCKAELDHWDAEGNRIWDIKTTGALPTFDPRQYLLQMAFYFSGIQEVLMQRPEAALAVVDKGGEFSRGCPFGFTVEQLMEAQARVNRLTQQWRDSMETGVWPSAGENNREALKVYWDSDYYPLLEYSRPTKIIYV